MEYDYVIVGGGISGLYIYFNLLNSTKFKKQKYYY